MIEATVRFLLATLGLFKLLLEELLLGGSFGLLLCLIGTNLKTNLSRLKDLGISTRIGLDKGCVCHMPAQSMELAILTTSCVKQE